MDIKDIKAIIDLMKKNSVSEFEMEKEGFKIRLKRDAGKGKRGAASDPVVVQAQPVVAAPSVVSTAPVAVPTSSAPAEPEASSPAPAAGTEVKSPMIGTFYRRPSPDVEPYVEVGTQVDPETVVCIIEAMKVMNELTADCKGTITEILVENAIGVEYGQPLLKIDPS